MTRTSCMVESAHWPFWMGLMKRFLNSLTEPRRFSLMKFTMQWSGKGRDTSEVFILATQFSSEVVHNRKWLTAFHHGGQQEVSHSIRLFCSGVPVSTILLLVLIEFIALDTAEASFFRIWPSSQITKSGPGENEDKDHFNVANFRSGQTTGMARTSRKKKEGGGGALVTGSDVNKGKWKQFG